MSRSYDILIIGAGIVGLTTAWEIKRRFPSLSVMIIDKESSLARHASGRNSGVLHAGFYYTSDSLKARLCVTGNRAMKSFCKEHNLPVNECGKLVVATDASEVASLHELHARGMKNGSSVQLISEGQAKALEPNVRTFKEALYSPETATISPMDVCKALAAKLSALGVTIKLGTSYQRPLSNGVLSSAGEIYAPKVVNCAGLYADKIAHDHGFGGDYSILPFKGLYLKYTKNTTDIRMNIYPVPNLKNPFLGVHFTKTVDGGIKIGPTAIPAWWRENYEGLQSFSIGECVEILKREAQLFFSNAFGFRDLALEEIRKYSKKYMVQLACKLIQNIDVNGFTQYSSPGIRAQLLNVKTRQLVQDFIVEGDARTIHVLNAVSPCFTCSFPFAAYIVDKYLACAP